MSDWLRRLCFLLAVSGFSFASVPAFQNDPPSDWSIMIYIDGRGSLDHAAQCTLGQLLSLPASATLSISVQLAFDGSQNARPGVISQARASCNFGRQVFFIPYWRGVRRFMLGAHRQFPGTYVGDFDMQSVDRLQDFVSWSVKQGNAAHSMLILWSHGEGVPYLEGWLRSETKHARKTKVLLAAKQVPERVQRQIARAHSQNDSVFGGRLLLNSEIAKALEAGLAGKKLDIIGFDACFKGMLETAYSMRSIADLMVSSEAREPEYGWDYSDWLAALVKTPSMTPAKLGNAIVDSYLRTSSPDADSKITLSVIDLTKISNVAGAIDSLSNYLLQDGSLWKSVNDARHHIFPYDLHEVDLDKFTENLLTEAGEVGSDDAGRLAKDLHVQLTQAILYDKYNPSAKIYGSAGLAIYFPSCQEEYDLDPLHSRYDPSSTEAISFAADHSWAVFLLRYLSSPEAICD